MLEKIVIYSLAAITLGIAIMLAPLFIILFFPAQFQTRGESASLTESTTKTFSMANVTRGLSINELSEIARFYGESDIGKSSEVTGVSPILTPLTILIPLAIVSSAGLLSAIIVKLFGRRLTL